MSYFYRGYYCHKNRISGKKVYSPVLQEADGPTRTARRWFLRAAEAEQYGVLLSLRATRLSWACDATSAPVRWFRRLVFLIRLWFRHLKQVAA